MPPPDRADALTRVVLQSLLVKDRHLAIRIADQPRVLKLTRRQAYAGAPHTQQLGQRLLGQRELVVIDVVLDAQQPAGAALDDAVQAVASRRLRRDRQQVVVVA